MAFVHSERLVNERWIVIPYLLRFVCIQCTSSSRGCGYVEERLIKEEIVVRVGIADRWVNPQAL